MAIARTYKDSTGDVNHARHVMTVFTAVKRAVIRILTRLVEFLAVSLSRRERGRGPRAIIRRYRMGSFFVLPDNFRSGFDGYRLRLELVVGDGDFGFAGRFLLGSHALLLGERGRGAYED